MKETPQVKLLDKLSFTLGVIVICLSEWLILRMPNYFAYFYYAIMGLLMAYRYYDYAAQKAELFMLDFCYFVNLSVMLQTAFYPDHLMWFKANYVLCMGPICIAIMVWKNSLVFHSLDKLTSFFLHAFPTMVCHIYRWRLVDHSMRFRDVYIGFEAHFMYPLGLYVVWQIGYLLLTEIILRPTLNSDLDIITSQRYLARDKKNAMNKGLKKFCRSYGFLGQNEEFDSESLLAKVAFVVTQILYTLVTILHPPLLFKSYYLSCVYLVVIFTMAVWNGASYYIEIFSTRYNLKFVSKPEINSERKESVASNENSENREDLEEFHDEFAEALEDIDINELLANHILLDDDTVSTTSSKGMNILKIISKIFSFKNSYFSDESLMTSREMSEEPMIKDETIENTVLNE